MIRKSRRGAKTASCDPQLIFRVMIKMAMSIAGRARKGRRGQLGAHAKRLEEWEMIDKLIA